MDFFKGDISADKKITSAGGGDDDICNPSEYMSSQQTHIKVLRDQVCHESRPYLNRICSIGSYN